MAFLKILLLATGETRDVSVKTLTLKAFKKSPSSWIRNLFVTNSMFLRSEHWPYRKFLEPCPALCPCTVLCNALSVPKSVPFDTSFHIVLKIQPLSVPVSVLGWRMGWVTRPCWHTHTHVCKTIRSIWDLRRDKSNGNHPRDDGIG